MRAVPGLARYLRDLVTGTADPEKGPPPGLDPDALVRLRLKVARALGAPDPGREAGLNAVLFEAYGR
eukprot:15163885-Alexandrium_andersonii.AAC.1